MDDELSTKQQAEEYIGERLSVADTAIESATSDFDRAMDALTRNLNVVTPSDVSTAGTNIDKINISAPPSGSPSWDSASLTAIGPPTLETFVPITPFGSVDIPAQPSDTDAPSDEVLFFEKDYLSGLLEDLKDSLKSGLVGGSGLSDSVEQALYDRDKLRREIESERQYDEVLYGFSSRGFALPPGALAAALQQAASERTRSLQDHSRDVMVKAAELEQENRKTVIQYATQVEGMLVGYHNSSQDRALDTQKTRLQMSLDVWTSTLDRYKNLMEAARISADILVAKSSAEADVNRSVAAVNSSRLESAKVENEINIATLEANASAFKAEVAAYEADVRAYEAKETTKVKAAEVSIQAALKDTEIRVKAAEVNIQAAIAVKSILLEAAKSGANVSAQVLASALNSVNAGVTYGFGGSYAYRASHNHDETKGIEGGMENSTTHRYNH